MPSLARLAALLGGLVFCASAMAADVDAESYGYPLANPFEATIATTPPELRPELPADGDIRQSDYSCVCARTVSSSCWTTSGQ